MEAFGSRIEADLIEALRTSSIDLISLVADSDSEFVGHILFSPVSLVESISDIKMAGLAPMAVLPKCQRLGVGTKLVEEGLLLCREAGYEAVIVLGYPEYYSSFGFVPSVNYGIRSEYDVPTDVFLVKELKTGVLSGKEM